MDTATVARFEASRNRVATRAKRVDGEAAACGGTGHGAVQPGEAPPPE
ncbi:hypothetical protein [Nocardia abscessus]|nr:hypothetical protein [Nocardia abscessus]